MPRAYLLAIDQGTTSTRAIVFSEAGAPLGSASREVTQHFPRPGWVEQDAEEVWGTVASTVPEALRAAGLEGKDLTAIGVTNQRETALLWDRNDGKPVGRAIVWQDRRTTEFCKSHGEDEDWLRQRTGLVLDPYFSATKWKWMFDNDPSLRTRSLAAGTVDSFLVWRLTGGRQHLTDRSNASRTLLAQLDTTSWDEELCEYFGVPRSLLPEIRPSWGDFGATRGLGFLPDGLPIRGVAGDQQAALFGQGCHAAGEAKCTYGTGAFFLRHLGKSPSLSQHRLLTTVAASGPGDAEYALEGAVFVAGAAVQWLRDGLKLFTEAPAIEGLARQSDPEQEVVFVPGFVGLGAPHWMPEARGALFGLTRGTTAADISRATLEGVAFQVADLVEAADADAGSSLTSLRVDGGMARNEWLLQCQADLLGIPVSVPEVSEATALGAALLAGMGAGIWHGTEQLRPLIRLGAEARPRMAEAERRARHARWRRAVRAVAAFHSERAHSSL
jgi:glycerol kinase